MNENAHSSEFFPAFNITHLLNLAKIIRKKVIISNFIFLIINEFEHFHTFFFIRLLCFVYVLPIHILCPFFYQLFHVFLVDWGNSRNFEY